MSQAQVLTWCGTTDQAYGYSCSCKSTRTHLTLLSHAISTVAVRQRVPVIDFVLFFQMVYCCILMCCCQIICSYPLFRKESHHIILFVHCLKYTFINMYSYYYVIVSRGIHFKNCSVVHSSCLLKCLKNSST